MKILIADDEQTIRQALVTLCKKDGMRCYEASDGQEAIDLIDSEKFDVAIIDYNMPVKDGKDVIRHIRDNDIQLPVVLISANSPSKQMAELEDLMSDVNIYIRKKDIHLHHIVDFVKATNGLSRWK